MEYLLLIYSPEKEMEKKTPADYKALSDEYGPEAGLPLIEEIEESGALTGYHLLHAAKADFLRRLGRHAEAAESYREALTLAGNEPERRFLSRRLDEAERAAGSEPLASP